MLDRKRTARMSLRDYSTPGTMTATSGSRGQSFKLQVSGNGALAEEARETSAHHAPRKNVMHTRIHERVREKERDTTVSITSCSNAAGQVETVFLRVATVKKSMQCRQSIEHGFII